MPRKGELREDTIRILEELERAQGDRSAVAERLGVSRKQIRHVVRRHYKRGLWRAGTPKGTQEKTRTVLRYYIDSGEDMDTTTAHFGMRKDALKMLVHRKPDLLNELRMEAGAALPEEIRRMQKKIEKRPLPKKGKIKRYLLTAAQNNVTVSPLLWKNIKALAKHYDAEILISSITYAKIAFGKMQEKRGAKSEEDESTLWWDDCLASYLDEGDKNIQLGNNLVWFGMLNILPTTVNPLSGYEVLTGTRSTIIPHNKLAYKSVPQAKGTPNKTVMTTGILTKASYLERSAGHKAIPHHTIGCLIAEVDDKGDHWVRQVHAHHTDDLHDLSIKVSDGKIYRNQEIESIVWGDIHTPYEHKEFRQAAWGKNGLLDTLKPKNQFFHDILDFRARNHHERANPHANYAKYIMGEDSITDEMQAAASFLRETSRPWCKSIVVDSNHDNAFTRYLREVDWRHDMPNAELNLEANLRILESKRENKPVHVVEWALQKKFGAPKGVKFLRKDESVLIKNIEHGMHGHIGPNGMRGTANSLRKMGKKATIGHSHSPTIVEGLWQVGTSSQLDLGYNVGPSSWSLTCCILYGNGKRSLLTFSNGKFHL